VVATAVELVSCLETEIEGTVSKSNEDASLQLLTPVPEEKLKAWLAEFYGKDIRISGREVLRHRDLSYVERLRIADALPESIIYKLVLPPWDVEQDLHERVLQPSITSSAQLFLSAHHGQLTALFLEDLGTSSLMTDATAELASRVGEELAKLHRSYCYRTDELLQMGVLRTLFPIDYEEFAAQLVQQLTDWQLCSAEDGRSILSLVQTLAKNFAGEPTSLVHGDLYAENIMLRSDRLFFIDWSWFTILGVPLMDLATLTMNHHKNGLFANFRNECVEAYCFEFVRDVEDVRRLLPSGEALSRFLFLHWLMERKQRGILGTTVGPVEKLISSVVRELCERQTKLNG
jgi:thiamine kinase-like enzyme